MQMPGIENLYAEHMKKTPQKQKEMLDIAKRDVAIQKGELTETTAKGIKIPSKLTSKEKADLFDSQKLNQFINNVLPAAQKNYRKNN